MLCFTLHPTATAELRFSTSFEYLINIVFFLVSFYNQMQQLVHNNCIEQNSTKISMSTQHTTNKSMHQLVNVNLHVDSTHNQHVHESLRKRQPTCRPNTSTNSSMHQSVNVNQPVDSIHQLIADCASMHHTSIHQYEFTNTNRFTNTNFKFTLL